MKFITLITTGLGLLSATAVAQAERPIFALKFNSSLFTQQKTVFRFQFRNNDHERLFFNPRLIVLYSSSNDQDPVYENLAPDNQLINPNDTYDLTLSAGSSTHLLGHENAEFSLEFEVARESAPSTDFIYTTDRLPLHYNSVDVCDCATPVDIIGVHT
jgi:hypothetical protein